MNAPATVSVKAAVKIVNDRLAIKYQLVNHGRLRIGVLNRIAGNAVDGSGNYDVNNAYVDIEGDELVIGKRVLPVPEGLQMSERLVPGFSLLAPGESITEVFELPLPVRANNPYRYVMLRGQNPDADVVASHAISVGTVRLLLGYFELPADAQPQPVSPAYPDVLMVWPPSLPVDKHQLHDTELSLPAGVQAMDYAFHEPAK